MTIGQSIFELRKNSRLTQSELAAKLSVSEQELTRYPNSDKIKLELAFAHSMLYRIGETDDEKKAGAEKAIALCEEVLATCFDEEILDDTYCTLARIYTETGKCEKAQAMLSRMSSDQYDALRRA
jgi:transcriptional regulator with XRE-family HTH domain